jgi:crossover junction endodeoxyribonuclease RuvC
VRVLGVDPGTATTGYGVVEPADGCPGRLVECGVIRPNPHEPMWCRLRGLYDDLVQLIEQHEPTVLAVESVFYAKNVRTTVVLGQARGVVLLAAAQAGLEVAEFPPARVKKMIVGAGAAAKEQVAYMVQKMLNLKSPPEPSDAADGVAVAVAYLLATRKP